MARDMEFGQVGVLLVMRTVKELVNVEMEPCSTHTDSTSGRDRNMELNQVPEKWLTGDRYVSSSQIA